MKTIRWVLLAGLIAGSVATVVQLLLWWLAGAPLAALLLRDTRLSAAVLLGPAVLPPPLELRPGILLAAMLVHLAVSCAWAVPALWLARRLHGPLPRLLAGLPFGLLVYLVDLYGFTLLFPWFAASRGAATLAAHLAFGLALLHAAHLSHNDGT